MGVFFMIRCGCLCPALGMRTLLIHPMPFSCGLIVSVYGVFDGMIISRSSICRPLCDTVILTGSVFVTFCAVGSVLPWLYDHRPINFRVLDAVYRPNAMIMTPMICFATHRDVFLIHVDHSHTPTSIGAVHRAKRAIVIPPIHRLPDQRAMSCILCVNPHGTKKVNAQTIGATRGCFCVCSVLPRVLGILIHR